jgi:hypothetical protein
MTGLGFALRGVSARRFLRAFLFAAKMFYMDIVNKEKKHRINIRKKYTDRSVKNFAVCVSSRWRYLSVNS